MMEKLLPAFRISVEESVYNKDPESSVLGKRIIRYSIELIAQLGFEAFTFKKLGALIESNESSIYRYFDNKHKLLIYLTSWYWAWLEYQLVIETHSIENHFEKLKKAIVVTTRPVENDTDFSHINEILLNQIIINENSKSFLTKEVDRENKDGYFRVYKRIIKRLNEMILNVRPDYPFSNSLASTIVETSLHQHFLKDHFPTITDCKSAEGPTFFLTDLVSKTLQFSES